MKLISWNVNGLRAILNKGFLEFVAQEDPDILCLQETKMQQGQAEIDLSGYIELWNSAEKKGYSGTAVFSKIKPLSVNYNFFNDEHIGEGRVITCEFEGFYLVNVYTPNSQNELARLPYRMQWEDAFRCYVNCLKEKKEVIICGDLNVAHQEIDLKNPKSNQQSAGFSKQEREKLTALLNTGFIDSFRFLYPYKKDAYTWWSYLRNARATNAGWRIDYFLITEGLLDQLKDALIYNETLGSDHCPVGLLLK